MAMSAMSQSGNSGTTTYWGYDNASQYNGQTLTFHSTTQYQTTDNGAKDAGGPFPGFDLVYGGSIYKWDSFRIGWDLGFDLMPMTISDSHSMSATVDQTTYTYNTGGIIMPGAGLSRELQRAGRAPVHGDHGESRNDVLGRNGHRHAQPGHDALCHQAGADLFLGLFQKFQRFRRGGAGDGHRVGGIQV